jgi:hypothetical protein
LIDCLDDLSTQFVCFAFEGLQELIYIVVFDLVVCLDSCRDGAGFGGFRDHGEQQKAKIFGAVLPDISEGMFDELLHCWKGLTLMLCNGRAYNIFDLHLAIMSPI